MGVLEVTALRVLRVRLHWLGLWLMIGDFGRVLMLV